jgi:hypothetical protein
MMITDAGTHDAVAGLAYVAAYLPDTGQTLLDLFTTPVLPEGERPSELVPPSASATTVPRCGSKAMVPPARCMGTATRRPSNGRSNGSTRS